MATLPQLTLDFNRKIKLSNDGGELSSDTGEFLFRGANIQKGVSELKKGNDFHYGLWRMDVNNLLTPISVESDDYL